MRTRSGMGEERGYRESLHFQLTVSFLLVRRNTEPSRSDKHGKRDTYEDMDEDEDEDEDGDGDEKEKEEDRPRA